MAVIAVEPDEDLSMGGLRERCKRFRSSHSFYDDLPLLTFCECGRWQIIEVETPKLIKCINIHGVTNWFDRE